MVSILKRGRALGGGSGLGWTSAFGEGQPLHVCGVLKDTRALQRFASRRSVRHGARLLQRRQRFHMQVPFGAVFFRAIFEFFAVHLKSLGANTKSVCTVPGVGTAQSTDLSRNQTACLPLPILEVPT